MGVAVWLDHTSTVITPPAYEERLREVAGQDGGEGWADLRMLDALSQPHRLQIGHHCHAFLVAEPSHRSPEIIAALLELFDIPDAFG